MAHFRPKGILLPGERQFMMGDLTGAVDYSCARLRMCRIAAYACSSYRHHLLLVITAALIHLHSDGPSHDI